MEQSYPKMSDVNKYISAQSEDTNTATLKSTKNMNNTQVMNLSNYIQKSNAGDNSFEFASNRPPMSGKVRGVS